MDYNSKCEITTATVSKVYAKEKINYINVKRDDNGVEIEDVHILASMAGSKYGTVFVPSVNQQVVIAVLNPQTQQAICLGCLYNSSNPPPYQINSQNSQIYIKYGEGWEMVIESKSGKESLTLKTSKKDEISMDQSKRMFTLKSSDGNNKIEMDCAKGTLNITSTKEINLYVAKNNGVTINSTGVQVKGATSVKLDATNIQAKAKAQASLEGATAMVKGTGTASIKGSGMTSIG